VQESGSRIRRILSISRTEDLRSSKKTEETAAVRVRQDDLGMKRRVFLKFLALLGFSGPTLLTSGCGRGAGNDGGGLNRGPDKVVAYKLSRRGQDSCKACRAHAENKLFLTEEHADANRVHAGCNCRIKPIWIPRAVHGRYFATGAVYDRRW
jgi:hypothetical protein